MLKVNSLLQRQANSIDRLWPLVTSGFIPVGLYLVLVLNTLDISVLVYFEVSGNSFNRSTVLGRNMRFCILSINHTADTY